MIFSQHCCSSGFRHYRELLVTHLSELGIVLPARWTARLCSSGYDRGLATRTSALRGFQVPALERPLLFTKNQIAAGLKCCILAAQCCGGGQQPHFHLAGVRAGCRRAAAAPCEAGASPSKSAQPVLAGSPSLSVYNPLHRGETHS